MHLRTRTPVARLTATAALALATLALGMAPAHGADTAASTDDPPEAAYTVSLTSSESTADYAHRDVDLTGTVTRADGSPVADAPVELLKSVLYDTWNPWGDPIDPTERETLDLGTVRTDTKGNFTLRDVKADRWEDKDSVFLFPRHRVEFQASYDPGDPSDNEIYFGDTTVAAQPVASTLTYKVNRTKVREGDTLIVTGKVTWPAGHGPVAGTRILLRTYYESAYNAQARTDANGKFTVRAKIRGYDNEFVVFSAPKDYYIAGASMDLPVKNVTRPTTADVTG
ncbi:acyl carrier protein [Streptomyces flavofungini]|uniref:acyl carrier protein n=1 Tax=Streptomyces flavofungini TaxID=68200 RepID=UPI0025B040A1|nr:acyl carrier protein [Streptomyces flavofungini]WJV44229.1 acyl carrier protein [Streptomyces flavofungini]